MCQTTRVTIPPPVPPTVGQGKGSSASLVSSDSRGSVLPVATLTKQFAGSSTNHGSARVPEDSSALTGRYARYGDSVHSVRCPDAVEGQGDPSHSRRHLPLGVRRGLAPSRGRHHTDRRASGGTTQTGLSFSSTSPFATEEGKHGKFVRDLSPLSTSLPAAAPREELTNTTDTQRVHVCPPFLCRGGWSD